MHGHLIDVALVARVRNEDVDAFESKEWMSAMQSVLDSIHQNGTWELCGLPVWMHATGTSG